jgi:hypothetical protein
MFAAFERGDSLEPFATIIEAMAVQAGQKFTRMDQDRKNNAYCDVLILRLYPTEFPKEEIPALLCRVYDFPLKVAREKVAGRDATGLTKQTGGEMFDAMSDLQRIERLRLFKK